MSATGGATAPERPSGYLELLLGNRDFRRLYLARLASLLGDWFNTLAVLALLRGLERGEGALAFGWILILKTLPALFVAPLSGVLVDRLSRKALLIGTDLFRAGVVLGLVFLHLYPSVFVLYGLIVLQTAAFAVAEPARNAVLPDVVAPRDLVTANALNAATWSAMFTVGTGAGGLVTHWFGPRTALVVDVGTYLVSAALIVGVAIPRLPARGVGVPLGRLVLGDVVEGLRFLAGRPRVLTLALAKTGWSLAGAITLVITILGERVYAGAPEQGILAVSVLYMARGFGTGLGPILARALARNDGALAERLIGHGYLVGAAFYLVLGAVDALPLAVLLLVLAHLGGSTVWVFSTVRLQALAPTGVRGRVFAAEQGCFVLAMSLSTFAYGAAIDAGLPLGALTSSLGLVLLVPGLLWWWRERRLGPPPAPS